MDESYQGKHAEKSAQEWAHLGDFHADKVRESPWGLDAATHSRLASEARKNYRIQLSKIGTDHG